MRKCKAGNIFTFVISVFTALLFSTNKIYLLHTALFCCFELLFKILRGKIYKQLYFLGVRNPVNISTMLNCIVYIILYIDVMCKDVIM